MDYGGLPLEAFPHHMWATYSSISSNPSEMRFFCFTFGITGSSDKVEIHTLMSPLKWSGNEWKNGVAFPWGKVLIPKFVIVSNKHTSYWLKPRISASDL